MYISSISDFPLSFLVNDFSYKLNINKFLGKLIDNILIFLEPLSAHYIS